MLGSVLEWTYSYYEEIIPLTFANNLGFSLVLGLPSFIVLTNERTSLPFFVPKRTVPKSITLSVLCIAGTVCLPCIDTE